MTWRSRETLVARRQLGFTIAELAVAMMLAATVLAAAAALYVNGIDMIRYGQVSAETSAATRRALGIVLKDVRLAASVVASANIGGTIYTSDSNTVVLKLPSSDGSSLRFTHFDYVAYDISSGALVQAVAPASGSVRPGGTRQLIPFGVTSLSFAYFRTDGSQATNWNEVANVRVQITVTRTAQKGPVAVTNAQSASLMNFGLSGG
ncbi:MAG: hypothetical protein ACUVTZ_05655 [Armatimonadota bacterium]